MCTEHLLSTFFALPKRWHAATEAGRSWLCRPMERPWTTEPPCPGPRRPRRTALHRPIDVRRSQDLFEGSAASSLAPNGEGEEEREELFSRRFWLQSSRGPSSGPLGYCGCPQREHRPLRAACALFFMTGFGFGISEQVLRYRERCSVQFFFYSTLSSATPPLPPPLIRHTPRAVYASLH